MRPTAGAPGDARLSTGDDGLSAVGSAGLAIWLEARSTPQREAFFLSLSGPHLDLQKRHLLAEGPLTRGTNEKPLLTSARSGTVADTAVGGEPWPVWACPSSVTCSEVHPQSATGLAGNVAHKRATFWQRCLTVQ